MTNKSQMTAVSPPPGSPFSPSRPTSTPWKKLNHIDINKRNTYETSPFMTSIAYLKGTEGRGVRLPCCHPRFTID